MQPVDQPQWTSPPAAPVPAAQARTWLIVLTAFLVELVIIAAVCNQGLADNFQRYIGRHQNGSLGLLAKSTQVYAWRYSSSHSFVKHVVLSEYLLLATLFVLTAVCVFALARGAVTFGRVLVGTWLAVVVATEVAAVVQLLVVNVHPREISKVDYALYFGPSGFHFVAGLVLGLVAGLLAGLVAVATRRPVAAAAPPERFDPQSGGLAPAPAPWSEQARPEDSFATAQFPVYTPPAPTFVPPPQAPTQFVPRDQPAAPAKAAEPEQPSSAQPSPPASAQTSPPASDATTQIPRVPPPPADDPNKTTMLPRIPFPRPPDDEDLGHQPE